MFFTDHNGKMQSTLSCHELTALGNIKIKDPCTMALETDREIMNLFDEMFEGDDIESPEYDAPFDVEYSYGE